MFLGRRKAFVSSHPLLGLWFLSCAHVTFTVYKTYRGALFFFFLFFFSLHWVFVAARGLFSSCGERGLLFIAVRRLLIAVASLVAEQGL